MENSGVYPEKRGIDGLTDLMTGRARKHPGPTVRRDALLFDLAVRQISSPRWKVIICI